MFRSLVFAGALAAAFVLSAPALAVRTHVRVEAPNATVYGATEPRVPVVAATFPPPDGPRLTLARPTALGALEGASRRGEFYYRVQEFPFGLLVDRIGRRAGAGTSGWAYKVNGVSPPVGADQYVVREGDRVLWYYATFGERGGPRTLHLRRMERRGCFRAIAADDAGRARRARNVVFRVDGRRVRSRSGSICPRRHWHALRAAKARMIRSQVVLAPRAARGAAPRLAAGL